STLRHLSPVSVLFHDAPPTETYTLSLHDALPISRTCAAGTCRGSDGRGRRCRCAGAATSRWPRSRRPAARPRRRRRGCAPRARRSEEHTSELQSRENLVCRLLLEKKKKRTTEHKT